jgi:alkanesulfonate monooxygenase SsuD/methylene tetrahydromethanopterin reductase-like flavin-dependent oxidoreductase (luciferase family)
MQFGLDIAQQRMPWAEVVSRAQFAESLGFDGVWGFDHFQPMYGEGPGECFEGVTTLAALTGVTDRVRMGLLVTGMTYRHPSVYAAEAITIDHASGGRLELAYGAAWFDKEHRELGIPFPPTKARVDAFEEAVQILRGSSRPTTSRSRASTSSSKRRRCARAPVQQPHPPIWIGAHGEAAHDADRRATPTCGTASARPRTSSTSRRIGALAEPRAATRRRSGGRRRSRSRPTSTASPGPSTSGRPPASTTSLRLAGEGRQLVERVRAAHSGA